MDFQLRSPAFENEGDIPAKYTCQGEEVSPPLRWENPPKGTASFALITEDLVKWIIITHWVVYNIPEDCRELPEAIPVQEVLQDGTCQGKNWRHENGYMGPCPIGGRHRYRFTIFALDTVLVANPRISKKRLLKAIDGHILDSATLLGYYAKK
ncbi:YbhB/YbcL family Raf kinase inhibitor-like protein [candidate division WOR-3 bacterium]|nr:YbhB/YbcL family Raf kinase inhibitor-like protein [candidate division WOR-3 bacterium]